MDLSELQKTIKLAIEQTLESKCLTEEGRQTIRNQIPSAVSTAVGKALSKLQQDVVAGDMANKWKCETDPKAQMVKNYVAEIDIDPPMYAGFSDPTNMMIFTCKYSEFPIYQVIFEDRVQKLVFEYLGEDHKMINDELSKLYPGCTIKRSYDDVIVNMAYANYKRMQIGRAHV